MQKNIRVRCAPSDAQRNLTAEDAKKTYGSVLSLCCFQPPYGQMVSFRGSLHRYHAQSAIHICHLKYDAIFYHGFYAANVTDVRRWIAVDENYVS